MSRGFSSPSPSSGARPSPPPTLSHYPPPPAASALPSQQPSSEAHVSPAQSVGLPVPFPPPPVPHAPSPSSGAQVRPRPSATSPEPYASSPDTLPHTFRPPARNPTFARLSNTPSRPPRRPSPPFPTPGLLDAARRPHPAVPCVVSSGAPFVTHSLLCPAWDSRPAWLFIPGLLTSLPLSSLPKSRSLPPNARGLPLHHFSRTPKAVYSHTCSRNSGFLLPTPPVSLWLVMSHARLSFLCSFFRLGSCSSLSEANRPKSNIGTKAQVLSVLISWVTDLRSYHLIDNVFAKLLSIVGITLEQGMLF